MVRLAGSTDAPVLDAGAFLVGLGDSPEGYL